MKLQFGKILLFAVLWTLLLALLRNCNNNPWGNTAAVENTLYTTFAAKIRNLDPISANFVHEAEVIDSVVEPPLAYHYLKRPYQLVPQLLVELPTVVYYDAAGNILPEDPDASVVARAEYTLRLRPGILYQDHPCFCADSAPLVKYPRSPADFGPAGNREVLAEDFLISMTRLCDSRSNCNVFSQLDGFLVGLTECRQAVEAEVRRLDEERSQAGESSVQIAEAPSLPDYRKIPCEAVQVVDRYTVKYVLSRKYPQFLYWLTMHYFAPTPYEAMEFYHRPEVRAAELKLVNWPVANGPYQLTKCDLDFQIVLEKNPNYHEAYYPTEGGPGDEGTEILADAGKRLPFIDRVVFSWEPESIPSWMKFQQGYYDNSGLPPDMFDKALSMGPEGGDLSLSEDMAARGMQMTTTVPPISYYYAFNMRDPVVGGMDKRHRLLRQALSIALDTRKFVTIFRNGNGIPAEGIIPPGIFGMAEPPASMNTVINRWNGDMSVRKDISEARRLLAQAGYPNGIDQETGEPLVIQLDHSAAGRPDFKNHFRWLADRFQELGVRLEERGTDLNRSRQRVAEGDFQLLFERGWVGDYPDPENFLMLFYSGNGQVEHHGPNYANYVSPEYDAVFKKLETMDNTPERKALIETANRILSEDAPVIWDIHPINMILTHGWLHNYRPMSICYDNLKYLRLDPQERARCQKEWNRPCHWPIWTLMALFTVAAFCPRRQR